MSETIKRLELAKTGNFGMDGTALTLQHLQEVAETFDGNVPVTIGHEMAKEDWFPRFGTVLTLEIQEGEEEESVLVGDVQMNDLLAEAYEEGMYTGWSVSFPARASDGKRYFHHLAFLGAVPPKIKDLKVIQEMEKGKAIDMGEAKIESTFNYAQIDFKEEGMSVKKPEKQTKEPEKKTPEAGAEENKKQQPGEYQFSDQQLKHLNKGLEMYKEGKRDKLAAAAKDLIPEEQKSVLMEFCDSLADNDELEFSDAEGKKEKRAPVDVLIDIFSSIPRSTVLNTEMQFSEPAGKSEPVDFNKLAEIF